MPVKPLKTPKPTKPNNFWLRVALGASLFICLCCFLFPLGAALVLPKPTPTPAPPTAITAPTPEPTATMLVAPTARPAKMGRADLLARLRADLPDLGYIETLIEPGLVAVEAQSVQDEPIIYLFETTEPLTTVLIVQEFQPNQALSELDILVTAQVVSYFCADGADWLTAQGLAVGSPIPPQSLTQCGESNVSIKSKPRGDKTQLTLIIVLP